MISRAVDVSVLVASSSGLHAYVVSSWKWARDLGVGIAMYVMLAGHDFPLQGGGGSPRRSVSTRQGENLAPASRTDCCGCCC